MKGVNSVTEKDLGYRAQCENESWLGHVTIVKHGPWTKRYPTNLLTGRAVKYYSMCREVTGGGYADGDVRFAPPLDDHYKVSSKLALDGLSVEVILDRKVRNLKSDFLLTTCGAFFVSKASRSVLEGVNADINFAPPHVRHFNEKSVAREYFLINPDEMPRCFDYELSECAGKSMVLSRIANFQPELYLPTPLRL